MNEFEFPPSGNVDGRGQEQDNSRLDEPIPYSGRKINDIQVAIYADSRSHVNGTSHHDVGRRIQIWNGVWKYEILKFNAFDQFLNFFSAIF